MAEITLGLLKFGLMILALALMSEDKFPNRFFECFRQLVFRVCRGGFSTPTTPEAEDLVHK